MPRDQWCPPTRVGKTSNRPSVLPSIARQNCDWDTLRAKHIQKKPSNNRLGFFFLFVCSRSQTSSLKTKRPDHNIEQIKTRIRTCAYTQKYKAWATHVMLARASTTSLACAQAPNFETPLWCASWFKTFGFFVGKFANLPRVFPAVSHGTQTFLKPPITKTYFGYFGEHVCLPKSKQWTS